MKFLKIKTIKILIGYAIFTIPIFSFAESESLQTQSIRLQQQQQALEKTLNHSLNIFLQQPQTTEQAIKLGEHESPCFPIYQFEITGHQAEKVRYLLDKIYQQSQFKSGMCLGTASMQYLQKLAQNIAIEEGFVTTQLYLAPQDLNEGVLTFSAELGYVDNIIFRETARTLNKIGESISFPQIEGKLLQLGELEQGLENLRRLPFVEAKLSIEPSVDKAYHSQIVVERQQQKSALFGVSINNAGSKKTGKYQGGMNLTLINPLGINDFFYASYNHDLAGKQRYRDAQGRKTDSGSQGYSLHYSFPIGRTLWTANHSVYRYKEATKGYYVNYQYSGKTVNSNLSGSWTLYRHKQHKIKMGAGLWRSRIYKYIDGNEIEVQRRQLGGWQANINYSTQFEQLSITANLSYKRGTGLFNSQPAPEEFNDQDDAIPGVAKMKVINASVELNLPFHIKQRAFSWDSYFYAQWHKTPLTPNDQLAIGGAYSVRGFDGEQNLSGERGWYWQNSLTWHYAETHKFYTALDLGRVAGRSTQGLPKQVLMGMELGLAGQFQLGGKLSYQFSIGKPLKKPNNIKTSNYVYGINLSYQF